MTTNRPLRVFLCHSSNDKPAVRELYQKLRAEPWIQPWLDEEELFPGMDWNLEIEKTIETTDVILVCLSNNSITKEGYVQKEIKTALDFAEYKPEDTIFIIPVRLEECDPPKRLSKWHYADCFEGQRERGNQRLLVSLKKRGESIGLSIKDSTISDLEIIQMGVSGKIVSQSELLESGLKSFVYRIQSRKKIGGNDVTRAEVDSAIIWGWCQERLKKSRDEVAYYTRMCKESSTNTLDNQNKLQRSLSVLESIIEEVLIIYKEKQIYWEDILPNVFS